MESRGKLRMMKNKVCEAQKKWEIERENSWAPGYMYITKIP